MIQGGFDMTTEEFLNSSEAVILVDRRGYEITEKTRTYAVYESAIIQFLKEERQKKFWKFRISDRSPPAILDGCRTSLSRIVAVI